MSDCWCYKRFFFNSGETDKVVRITSGHNDDNRFRGFLYFIGNILTDMSFAHCGLYITTAIFKNNTTYFVPSLVYKSENYKINVSYSTDHLIITSTATNGGHFGYLIMPLHLYNAVTIGISAS